MKKLEEKLYEAELDKILNHLTQTKKIISDDWKPFLQNILAYKPENRNNIA